MPVKYLSHLCPAVAQPSEALVGANHFMDSDSSGRYCTGHLLGMNGEYVGYDVEK